MNGRESLLLPVRLTLDATTIDTRQRGAYGAASVWVQLSNPNQQAVRNANSSCGWAHGNPNQREFAMRNPRGCAHGNPNQQAV